MTPRRSRARARVELELALLDEADRLQDAKDAYAADPSPENRTRRKAEMESLAETRTWLRTVDEIRKTRQEMAEAASEGATSEELAGFQERIDQLRAQYGPLIDAMQQLATAPSAPPEELPPGSVQVRPKVVRATSRAGKDGL